MKKIILILLLITGCSKIENRNNEKIIEETYYCRKSTGNYLHKAELNTKESKLTSAYIEDKVI